MKNFAGTRGRIAAIGEADDLAGGLKQKRQRGLVFAPFEGGIGVARGLRLMRGEVFARLVAFGFT